ncbi:MAG: YggT family protein [Pseudanabaena sp. RU_4_16]|nr:YggT family protein [Pseudanabaena sp. RU_4_16]
MDTTEVGLLGLNLLLGLLILLNVFRIILTWYPQISLDKFPFKLIAIPTEPLLFLLRRLIPPLGGVDITPVIGVGIFSLIREMLLGQQGILTMMQSLN